MSRSARESCGSWWLRAYYSGMLDGARIGGICDLPASPEGAIKIDEICRDLRVAVGKIILALQQLGLCRDDIQEVDRTLRVTLPGASQRGLIFSDGPGDIAAPVWGFAMSRQGIFDRLPG